MDDRAKQTLEIIFADAGIKGEFEVVQAPLKETRMWMYGPVLVVFSDKSRITEIELNKLIEFHDESGASQGMVVVSHSTPSEAVLKSVRTYLSNPNNPLLQIFEIKHLGFDISKHRNVPRHRVLIKDELASFMKEFGLTHDTLSQLPKLDCLDPMAKRIRARPGDVVEITGLSQTSGEYRHARLVRA